MIITLKSTFTIISQMIGGSIVAIPSLFYMEGWLLSVILFLTGAAISLLNYHYMIILSNRFKCSSYRELISAVVSKKLAMAVDILIIV